MRSELRFSLVIVAQEGNATPSRDAVPDRVAVEVVDEEDRRCRRLQADADVLNEGSKVNERRSTGSHKCKDGWLDLWVTSPALAPRSPPYQIEVVVIPV
jgi:hypothetical protein